MAPIDALVMAGCPTHGVYSGSLRCRPRLMTASAAAGWRRSVRRFVLPGSPLVIRHEFGFRGRGCGDRTSPRCGTTATDQREREKRADWPFHSGAHCTRFTGVGPKNLPGLAQRTIKRYGARRVCRSSRVMERRSTVSQPPLSVRRRSSTWCTPDGSSSVVGAEPRRRLSTNTAERWAPAPPIVRVRS